MTATVRQCTGADHPHRAERSPSLKLGYSDTPLINHYGDTRLDSPKHANVASRSIKDESDSAPINQKHSSIALPSDACSASGLEMPGSPGHTALQTHYSTPAARSGRRQVT